MPGYFDQEAVEVSNGTVKLNVINKESTLKGQEFDYKLGGISTAGKYLQQGGCYIASIKLPNYSGICPAFWLLAEGGYGQGHTFFDSNAPSKGCCEIDIIESSPAFGGGYSIAEHYYDLNADSAHTSKSNMVTPPADIYDGEFHTFGLVDLPDASYYYCDGELMVSYPHTYTGDNNGAAIGVKKSYMILSVAINANGPNEWTGSWSFTEKDFPLTTEVDWVNMFFIGLAGRTWTKATIPEMNRPHKAAPVSVNARAREL